MYSYFVPFYRSAWDAGEIVVVVSERKTMSERVMVSETARETEGE